MTQRDGWKCLRPRRGWSFVCNWPSKDWLISFNSSRRDYPFIVIGQVEIGSFLVIGQGEVGPCIVNGPQESGPYLVIGPGKNGLCLIISLIHIKEGKEGYRWRLSKHIWSSWLAVLSMGESFQDYSWIQDFEKVSLKILNSADKNNFTDLVLLSIGIWPFNMVFLIFWRCTACLNSDFLKFRI